MIIKKNFIVILLTLLVFSCTFNQDKSSWIGEYQYEEEPVKALAGYYMAMVWNLNISQQNNNYIGKIEINGQQTYMVIQARIVGNNEKIKLVFDKGLDGTGFTVYSKGDMLFELEKVNGRIITKWDKLTPFLLEKFKNDTVCFNLKNN